jgi:hypothetical protein
VEIGRRRPGHSPAAARQALRTRGQAAIALITGEHCGRHPPRASQ